MLRGKAAFHIEERDEELHIIAELVRGAQTRRRDWLVFSRKAALRSSTGAHYTASLKIIHSGFHAHRFCNAMARAALDRAFEGTHIALADGTLHLRIPISETSRKTWIRAKSGNTYTVVPFGLPTDIKFGDDTMGDFLVSLSMIRRDIRTPSQPTSFEN